MVFVDIAGQVRRENASPVLAICAVAVPRESEKRIRLNLLKSFAGRPVKWKDGGLDGFVKTSRLIVNETLPVVVIQLTSIGSNVWREFCDDGERFVQQLLASTGQRAEFSDVVSVMRMYLLDRAFGRVVGHVLRRRGYSMREEQRPGRIEFQVVNDWEIQNDSARKVLVEQMEEWPRISGFLWEQQLDASVSVRFAHEQDEQLLYLPDYIAGAFYHADPDAILEKPVAAVSEVRDAVQTLRDRHGDRLHNPRMPFAKLFPLGFKDGDVFKRGRPQG